MNSKQYTDYRILKIIDQKSDVSQRFISKQTGINVASVNFALKRLAQKGYVKVTTISAKRILYHLTHSGISQKAKLAYGCFLRNYHLFSDIREIVSLHFENHPNLKGKKIGIFGLNEITEITYFCMKKNGVHFAGVYEDEENLVDTEWLGEPVQSVESLRRNGKIDYLIDVKSADSSIPDLTILTPEEFIKKRKENEKKQIYSPKESLEFQLKICGAANSVTGSSILLKAGKKNILIDCGMTQGSKKDSMGKNLHFEFDPSEINYLFLTHAHLDHSGRIPQLIDRGFKGEILCHHATVDLLPVLLEDSFKLNGDIKYDSSSDELMEKVTEQCWGFEYNIWNQISKNLRFRFLDAGHILGSVSIQFDIDGQYVVFSGDIGNNNTGIIRDPAVLDRADILVIESTYGGRSHKKIDKKETFKQIISRAINDNGKVLIPAFAVGRTQEIIYQLNDLVEKGEIKDVPVFVDSPMGIKITKIYQKHKECFDKETLRRLESKDDPLDFNKLFAVDHYRDSIQIDSIKGPAIIIAGSGMCTGGRILNHIVNLIEDKTTDMVFVGYQAEGTTGADILRFSKQKGSHVIVNGEKVYIKAKIHKISGFSAHADHDGLINWVERIEQKPHTIYLNHGEPEAQTHLKRALQDKFKNISIYEGSVDE